MNFIFYPKYLQSCCCFLRAVAALTDQHELAGNDGGVNQFHDFTEKNLQV